jgi:MYXO-CTERM domain-containing protein
VIRVQATYEPSGTPVDRFGPEGELGLVYPLLFQGVGFTDTVLRSEDGRSWTALESNDAVAQQSVHASVPGPAYFAVGQTPSSSPAGGPGSTGSKSIPVVIAVVAVLLGAFAFLRRRSRRPPPKPPRPPSDDESFDPWKV